MEPIAHLLNDPYEVAEALENEGLLTPHRVRTFSCACCRLVWSYIPTIGQEALVSAETYLNHNISDEQLESVRVKLWAFLKDEACNFTPAIVNAIRAVICCLYSDTSMHEADDLYGTVTITMDFCNHIVPYQQQQLQLLRDIFPMSQQ